VINDAFLEMEPGRRLHYLGHEGTRAQSYLLIHGLASTATFWKPVIRELPAGARVVALEQRGHGLSTPTPDYDNDGLVADVVAVVEKLGLAPVNLVGHSWGADVALQVAARRPSLVTSLALVDGGIWDLGQLMNWEECRETLAPPDLSRVQVGDVVAYIRSMALEVAELRPRHPPFSAPRAGRVAGGECRPRRQRYSRTSVRARILAPSLWRPALHDGSGRAG
jgi:pimeloyl-ACP methyl ester carboxylesterase